MILYKFACKSYDSDKYDSAVRAIDFYLNDIGKPAEIYSAADSDGKSCTGDIESQAVLTARNIAVVVEIFRDNGLIVTFDSFENIEVIMPTSENEI